MIKIYAIELHPTPILKLTFKQKIMNIEIKFRAWVENKMYYFDLSDTIAPSLEDNVMQFTGLKDKNGVDIYEGDVIANKDGANYKVLFREFSFTTTYNEIHFCDLKYFYKENIEVIGNIYENPEFK